MRVSVPKLSFVERSDELSDSFFKGLQLIENYLNSLWDEINNS